MGDASQWMTYLDMTPVQYLHDRTHHHVPRVLVKIKACLNFRPLTPAGTRRRLRWNVTIKSSCFIVEKSALLGREHHRLLNFRCCGWLCLPFSNRRCATCTVLWWQLVNKESYSGTSSCRHHWNKDIHCNVDSSRDPERILHILNNT